MFVVFVKISFPCILTTLYHNQIFLVLRALADPLDLPVKMDLTDSPAPLDLLDPVVALESLVLLYVTHFYSSIPDYQTKPLLH